jgi:multiple antibiotic resistance protein
VEQYLQGTITILSLINPVICGLIFSQAVSGQTKTAQRTAAIRSIFAIMMILGITAISGAFLLKTFGISLDAFQAAGGLVLGWMGLQMLQGTASPTANETETPHTISLIPLILFAASPGTIAGVITLSITHSRSAFPLSVLVSIVIALAITLVLLLATTGSKSPKKQSLMHDVTTRFMGLIVLAMGMQFSLTGLKAFFAV